VKRWLNRLGQDLFETLILVKDGDCKCHAPCLLEPRMTELAELCRLKEKIIEESQCFSLKDLAINGTDIMRLGFTGKAVGEQLQWALLEVIEQRLPNDKETLLAAVSKKA
jgi:tRNA nucleotidyltransferase (CCA-adding enzyme)